MFSIKKPTVNGKAKGHAVALESIDQLQDHDDAYTEGTVQYSLSFISPNETIAVVLLRVACTALRMKTTVDYYSGTILLHTVSQNISSL